MPHLYPDEAWHNDQQSFVAVLGSLKNARLIVDLPESFPPALPALLAQHEASDAVDWLMTSFAMHSHSLKRLDIHFRTEHFCGCGHEIEFSEWQEGRIREYCEAFEVIPAKVEVILHFETFAEGKVRHDNLVSPYNTFLRDYTVKDRTCTPTVVLLDQYLEVRRWLFKVFPISLFQPGALENTIFDCYEVEKDQLLEEAEADLVLVMDKLWCAHWRKDQQAFEAIKREVGDIWELWAAKMGRRLLNQL